MIRSLDVFILDSLFGVLYCRLFPHLFKIVFFFEKNY